MKLGIKKNRKSVIQGQLVRTRPLFEGGKLPLLVEPELDGVDLVEWGRSNRAAIEPLLHEHGGLLFRGFHKIDRATYANFADAVCGELLPYKERSSPRHQVSDKNVYTSTDYPPSYNIFLHNENSYQNAWPMKVFFFCEIEPKVKGETPLADCRRLYAKIPQTLREKFQRLGVMYMRNFGDRYGLTWQNVFGTDDQALVEALCSEKGIEVQWKGENGLRTLARRQLVTEHPVTDENVWFNHATFFHVSTLEAPVREALLADLAEEDLPSNSYYGDGSPIEPEVLDQLRAIYLEEKLLFPWKKGDILLIDNMLTAHGRSVYEGERSILVAMGDPFLAPKYQPCVT